MSTVRRPPGLAHGDPMQTSFSPVSLVAKMLSPSSTADPLKLPPSLRFQRSLMEAASQLKAIPAMRPRARKEPYVGRRRRAEWEPDVCGS